MEPSLSVETQPRSVLSQWCPSRIPGQWSLLWRLSWKQTCIYSVPGASVALERASEKQEMDLTIQGFQHPLPSYPCAPTPQAMLQALPGWKGRNRTGFSVAVATQVATLSERLTLSPGYLHLSPEDSVDSDSSSSSSSNASPRGKSRGV